MGVIDRSFLSSELYLPGSGDDKYSRGVILAATGSPTYPGAAVLSVTGAALAGAGFVRYVGPERCENLVLSSLPEAVIGGGRFDAAAVGSGWDSSMASFVEALVRDCADKDLPVVVDAGAVRGVKEWARDNPRIIATPHAGEAESMFSQFGITRSRAEIEEDVPAAARKLADLSGAVIVVKAAQTAVAAPDCPTFAFTAPTAWGATAGAGDVLGGVIAAFVGAKVARDGSAKGSSVLELTRAAAAAVGVHGFACAMASGVLDSKLEPSGTWGHPIIASDIAKALPSAIGAVLVEE